MDKKNNFKTETTTVWSFPERGKWLTHNPEYRGNFAPQIARNIILRYSKIGDVVLDPMVGSGTTLIECKILKRRGIGLDINPEAVYIAKKNLEFETNDNGQNKQKVEVGDVRKLDLDDCSIDLILTHPPYLDIIKYSKGKIAGDLSNIKDVKLFCDELEKGIKEFFRVLKPDAYCAILIGDTRKNKHYVPLSYYILERFLKNGFAIKEDIIKIQHNCRFNSYWKRKLKKYNFLLIQHEHLFVFRKPRVNENLSRIKYSVTCF